MANSNITKNAIRAAFLEVLSEKPLGKITVNDIAHQCGINRNTFYYHYQDIPALLEEVCETEVLRIVREYPELNSLDECAAAVMEFAIRNRKAVSHIYNSNSNGAFISSLWRICEYVVTKYIDTIYPDAILPGDDRAMWIRFFKCTIFGLTAEWISTGMKDEAITSIQSILQHTRGVSDFILSNYSDRGK